MDLQGKVIAVLPERSGVSARGPWKSQSFVVETHEQYPKQMVFDVFGEDRLNQFQIKLGDEILVSFDITAHEYQGRWFNNIRAWNVQHVDPATIQQATQPQAGGVPFGAAPQAAAPQASAQAAPQQPTSQAPFPPQQPADGGAADDLPF